MQILPVIDLLDGLVVRGVAGKRNEYRPVVSRLSATPEALPVARAFRDQLGLSRLYVADLDAILRRSPNLEIYRALADDGFELLVDAGLRSVAEAAAAIDSGAAKVIAGLETWPGPGELAALCVQLGAAQAVFSLDLQSGRPVGQLDAWKTSDPFTIACQVVESGVTELIALDVAQVGVGEGVTTMPLCRRLMDKFPGVSVMTGGGVRHAADLRHLQLSGVSGVLVASALHDGRIGAAEIAALTISRT